MFKFTDFCRILCEKSIIVWPVLNISSNLCWFHWFFGWNCYCNLVFFHKNLFNTKNLRSDLIVLPYNVGWTTCNYLSQNKVAHDSTWLCIQLTLSINCMKSAITQLVNKKYFPCGIVGNFVHTQHFVAQLQSLKKILKKVKMWPFFAWVEAIEL